MATNKSTQLMTSYMDYGIDIVKYNNTSSTTTKIPKNQSCIDVWTAIKSWIFLTINTTKDDTITSNYFDYLMMYSENVYSQVKLVIKIVRNDDDWKSGKIISKLLTRYNGTRISTCNIEFTNSGIDMESANSYDSYKLCIIHIIEVIALGIDNRYTQDSAIDAMHTAIKHIN